MTSSAHSRPGAGRPIWDAAAFLLPFLIQIGVLPGWALGRLAAASPDGFEEFAAAGWPLLLIPAFAVALAVYWRRKPENTTRLYVFTGAATGAVCIIVFFVFALSR